MTRLVECVPNFSEGRDASVIRAVSDALESVEGAMLLHTDVGFDANRTVMTFAAEPEAAVEAGFRAAAKASELIDMRKHKGVHRRIGAADVFPFIPYEDMTFEDCAQLARKLASRVAEELGIPVYLYGKAANMPERARLPDIRRGGYELLDAKLQRPDFAPDFGEPVFHPTAGAAVIGVRDFLLAYNVNLNTSDVSVAKRIARKVRESGKIKRDNRGRPLKDGAGTPLRIPGRLASCQADGWFIEQYGTTQVTMNLLNMDKTGLHTAFEAVREEAESLGAEVKGSELIGMCPKRALIAAGEYFLGEAVEYADESQIIRAAVRGLGLDSLSPFVPEERVLEYALSSRRELLALKRELR